MERISKEENRRIRLMQPSDCESFRFFVCIVQVILGSIDQYELVCFLPVLFLRHYEHSNLQRNAASLF